MRSTTVSLPDGKRWVVRRRWLPWGIRWRGPRTRHGEDRDSSWFDWIDIAEPLLWFDEGLGGFGAALGVILLLLIALLFLLPLFAFVVELLLVAAVAFLIFAFRVVFRRPWVVEAAPTDESGARLGWKVTGFRRSGEAVDEIARQLEAGVAVPSLPSATPIGPGMGGPGADASR